ncbi:MAG: putative metal-binding motif-containing protein, partial [Polyangia bacterium]
MIGISAGCHGPDAVLLTVTADAPVEQYQIFLHDDDAQSVVYSSGFISVSSPGQQLDLTHDQLKLALKLSRGGHFTLLLVGVIGEVVNGKPASSAKVLFWAGKIHVDGANSVNARLLTVPPGDDADGDYFPDAGPFMEHVAEAATLYAGKTDVLDCNDKDMMPVASDGTPISIPPDHINPFATEICGDGYDENCSGSADEACVDKDGDHDVHGHDCDDNDPKRHHPTDIDPYPDPPNCCGYSLGKLGTADENTNFLGTDLCPTQRCGDGIDESCRDVANDPKNDTTCIVDADCDGYPAMVNGQVVDCDDNDPAVHPGAVEACGSTKDLNCNGTIGEGCVPCDLDGDGYERTDAVNNCPDASNKHPGMIDCNDDDAGVFPGATSVAGGSEGGVSVGKVAAALRGFCRGIYEAKTLTGTAKINPFGGAIGDADCNGKPFEGCPALIDPGCDVDGDGWPGVAMSNGKNCNPNNVTLDCDDNDPTTFPSAPVNCKSNRPTYKENCTPQGVPDCTGDVDGDGYAAPADCDDKDPTVHPFALEICDGKDNDCDGLVDEGNPDPTGKPLVTTGAITSCTDSNTGECAKTKGTCVCSIAQPVKDPLLAQLGQPRLACPGEGASPKATSCFGAGQPKPQSCDASAPKDDDCDGRVDAPDGARLAVKGMTCGINVGQCKAGVVIACDMSKTNCFESFGRTPAATAWYGCSTAAPDPVTVCPVAEACNGLDDDCDGIVGNLLVNERDIDGDHYLACSGCGATLGAGILGCGDCNDLVSTIHPGATETCNGVDDSCAGAGYMDGKDDCGKGGNAGKPTCCGGSGCRDTTSDYQFCGSCSNNCSIAAPTTTNECYQSNCSCATGGACTGGLTCQGVAPAGMCVAGNGSSCTMANQCSSGNCVDMHCCVSSACGDGVCKACTGAGGTCVNQPANMPGNGCTGAGQVCDGGGACKKATGQACGSSSECWNGLCVDGYCCNTACNTSQCQACNVAGSQGTCSLTTGAPIGGRTACNGSGTCGGTCDGTHQTCQYPGGGTACGSQTCAPGAGGAVVTPVGSCNGAGSCTQTPQTPCAYTQCNGNVCASSCTLDNQCVNSDYCSTAGSGTCITRHGNGTTCVPDDCEMSGACN